MDQVLQGLAALAVLSVLIFVGIGSYRLAVGSKRGAASPKDAGRRPLRPDPDAADDAESRPITLAARLDEVEYRFDALKRAHEQLAESIGTRFATMGKRIARGSSPAAPADAEDDPRQFDLLADIGPAPARSGLSASHNGQRRLIARGPKRR